MKNNPTKYMKYFLKSLLAFLPILSSFAVNGYAYELNEKERFQFTQVQIQLTRLYYLDQDTFDKHLNYFNDIYVEYQNGGTSLPRTKRSEVYLYKIYNIFVDIAFHDTWLEFKEDFILN